MTYVWVSISEHSHTLYDSNPDHKLPRKMAWVSPTFESEFKYKAFIIKSQEYEWFESLEQAKDWAQAVVLLTH